MTYVLNNKNEKPLRVLRDRSSSRLLMVQARDHQGNSVDLPVTGVHVDLEPHGPGTVTVTFHALRVEIEETNA